MTRANPTRVGCREVLKLLAVEAVALGERHGPGREVDAACNGGGGKDGVQMPFDHHLFDQHLPVGQMARMMGGHVPFHDVGHCPVVLQGRIPLEAIVQISLECRLLFRIDAFRAK